MRILIIMAVIACLAISCNTSFVTATFGNKNVYKTKAALPVKKVYDVGLNGPSIDQQDFFIVPNAVITKTTTSSTTLTAAPATVYTTTTETTIPPSSTTTTYPAAVVAANVNNVTTTTVASTVPAGSTTAKFIRYKVVSEEGDYKYIRILSGCQFDPINATHIIIGTPTVNDPHEYIFQVSKKDLQPNTHYLASTALIGKIITLPMRIRKDYWDNDNKVVQGAIALNYGFGWKYKFGNNPYRGHYLSTVLYAAGISAQKHFSVVGNIPSEKKDEFALTYLSLGVAYEYEKFNVGVFWGKDKMFGNLKNWAYQDRWWWGVGIGYDLFK